MNRFLIPVLLVSAAVLAGCANPDADKSTSTTPTGQTTTTPGGQTTATPLKADLLESGSTFVLPLVQKMASEFNKLEPGVTVSANGGGSGKGKGDITNRLVDIGGSDSVMNDSAIAAAGGDILHLPIAAGAIVIAYNLPEVTTPLKFDSTAIANIFMGKITKWNDPALVALNPGVALPDEDLAVVHRSDGSGTTDTFTDYLSKANAEWKSTVGKGTSVSWPCEAVTPACTGANGNNGVGGQVKSIPYSIAYLGGEWADITQVQVGLVVNAAGKTVDASAKNVGASIAAAVASGAFDAKLRGSVTNQPCDDCYPIAAVAWFLVHQEQADLAKGRALAAFLDWAIHDGQKLNSQLNYLPIPASVVDKEEVFIASMRSNGKPLMS